MLNVIDIQQDLKLTSMLGFSGSPMFQTPTPSSGFWCNSPTITLTPGWCWW